MQDNAKKPLDDDTSEAASTSKRQRIEHLDQREWVLTRPETYVGALEPVETKILEFGDGTMMTKSGILSPALLSLTKELFDNALDNCQRDKTQKYIKVRWENGALTVKNDGSTLPVEKNSKSENWSISLAFGTFQTGSNFDDAQGNKQSLYTVGRNGVGCKGCNVFSTRFEVQVMNSQDKKTFHQVWETNMSVVHPPKITICTRKTNETSVSWYPDFDRLGGRGSEAFMKDVCRWYSYNASLCAPLSVKVYFEDKLISLRSTEHFCKALGGTAPLASDVVEMDERAVLQICVAARDDVACTNVTPGLTYAFVNGTPCDEGSHAKYILSKIATIVETKARTKRGGSKDLHATPSFVQTNAVVVAVLFVQKERFTDQRKRVLDTPVRDWGWTWEPSRSFISTLERSNLPEQLIVSARDKSDMDAAKATKSTSRNLHIAKYEPALKRYTNTATLIVCEGDSAGNLVRSGLTVVGRKDYGLYPLRGKFLNVRGLGAKTILENKEALELLKILGIQLHTEYDDDLIQKLPYQKLMVMTDQDVDGSHIMGLLFNFVDVCAPSLLRRKKNYLSRFATSLIRVTVNKKEVGFYSQVEYDRWVDERKAIGQAIGTPKYFKGLGTSSAEQAKEYFRSLAQNTITMVYDGDESSESLDLTFNKKRADDRKLFLTNDCDPLTFVDYSQTETTVQDFVHNELLPQYAMASLKRSIPSLDGFKEALRKVFFGARELKLTTDISVANAAGKISSYTNYHHRGTAMEDTIIGMAANYTGCSNINLLLPHGQFGTRHKHAAASAAYPKVCLNSPMHELLFPPVDDPVLSYVIDEGKTVEPVMYAPIVPLPLVLGCQGIATGWSTNIPMFHPLDVIELTRKVIVDEDVTDMHLFPWYRGFSGMVTKVDETTYSVTGMGEWKGSDFHVTEIPPFRETEAFKEEWTKAGYATGGIHVGELHTDEKVHFILKGCNPMKKPIEELGLVKTVSLGNMHLLDVNAKLKKYHSVVEIVQDYVPFRLEMYVKRLNFVIRKCEHDVLLAKNRARFIEAYMVGDYDMRKYCNDQEAEEACKTMGYDTCAATDGEVKTYTYLTMMPLRSLTAARAASLTQEAIKKEETLKTLREKEPVQLWLDDLEALKSHISKDPSFSRVETSFC
jgi:DNA topoisomerase-2